MTHCPPWCTEDHDGEFRGHHLGAKTTIGMARRGSNPYDEITVTPARYCDGSPQVLIHSLWVEGTFPSPAAWLCLDDAASVAGLVEMLATATAAQHRALAAAIRDATAVAASTDENPERAT